MRGKRNPLHLNTEVATWCQSNNILFQAFSPFGGGGNGVGVDDGESVLTHPIIVQIAKENKLTPAQVLIRWNIQQGVGVVVRTSDVEHLAENLDTFSLGKLSHDDMYDINLLNTGAEREPKPVKKDGDGDKVKGETYGRDDINAIMNALMGDIFDLADFGGGAMGEKKKEDKKKEEKDEKPMRRRHLPEDQDGVENEEEGDVFLRDDDL